MEGQNKSESFFNKKKWAGPDLNQRPSARQADVLTELDYRPIACFMDTTFQNSFRFPANLFSSGVHLVG